MAQQPFDDIRALIADLPPADAAGPADPALGGLAGIIDWITAWRGSATMHRPIIALYAGAHAGAGDVDAIRARLESLAAGGAVVSRAAMHLGAGLDVFDLAIDRPVAAIARGPAMSERECAATMAFGMEALAKQPDLLVLGALGAGVHASAAAIAQALFGGASADWTSQDTEAAVQRGLAEAGGDPLQILRQLGGRETAAIAGAILAARTQRAPVLLEGYPAAAAAAVLQAVAPEAIAHCRVGQIAGGPGHARLVDRLGLTPLVDLGMTLEDGTGSAVALSLVKLACALPPEAAS
jgi:nicotinate-nucleotide--dimethylbenzimidazole phosphoribosyltransferase